MTKCILIFEEFQNCLNLIQKFEEKSISVSEATVVSPAVKNITAEQRSLIKENEKVTKVEPIDKVRTLNPKLDRAIRQRSMMIWLMPFGFIAGLTFSKMTNLSTFSFIGLNKLGESLLGGILGMASGYMGSFFSAASININRNKEIRSILNYNKNGKWLILIENQVGLEMPWLIIKESEAIEMIILEN